ncbi:DNA/RNA endonuclease G [Leucobacter rhizosphaerae]|uniref:DNA/RNA endonuclease G n=1 Tax=Leucobacter rhizosphaerae TaxID=2932245 RepID=A0ABY4FSX7_9MICO|nr:DNA/RNA endonuclease G [Leucobacter rhizosphaerae]UOQ59406.1 DNA/RNA endonuclease G [Leucobacter rhizosphaerae]
MTSPALRRVIRRETHSPRTVAMIVAVVLCLLGLGYLGIELVLGLLAQPALLIDPSAGWSWILGLPSGPPVGLLVTGGVILAVAGVLCIWLAIAPGRLSKHTLEGDGRAVVVDNGVIAASLAQHLSETLGLPRDAVLVGVARRTVDVTLRPDPDVDLETAEVRSIADAELSSYRLSRPMRTTVRVARRPERDSDS